MQNQNDPHATASFEPIPSSRELFDEADRLKNGGHARSDVDPRVADQLNQIKEQAQLPVLTAAEITQLLRAQKEFISAQTFFLHQPNTLSMVAAQQAYLDVLAGILERHDPRALANLLESFIAATTASYEQAGIL